MTLESETSFIDIKDLDMGKLYKFEIMRIASQVRYPFSITPLNFEKYLMFCRV